MVHSRVGTEVLVEVEGLVKSFGPVQAVRGIDIEIRRGEVFGFLGPNGAGKTTTIRCLLGLLRPTAGRITAFGLSGFSDGVAIRRRISYVPGELRLPERISALDFVDMVGGLRGGFDPARRDSLAERLRLDLRRNLRELSTGNRRKVALLVAFLADAELLVLDEPTNGLDPLLQHEFLAMLREAKSAGRTIFLSSHMLSEVQRAADRVVVLRAGRVVASGTVAELRGRARQRVEVWFEGTPPAAALMSIPGVEGGEVDGPRFTAMLSGAVQPLLQLLAHHEVASLLVEEPDLEEAFLNIYGGTE